MCANLQTAYKLEVTSLIVTESWQELNDSQMKWNDQNNLVFKINKVFLMFFNVSYPFLDLYLDWYKNISLIKKAKKR